MERAQELTLTESSFNVAVLDLEEEYQVVNQAFTGVKDISQADQAALAAAVGVPQTVINGRDPAGMNATGSGDAREWNSMAQQYQTHHLTEPAERIVQLIAYSVRANNPEGWGIQWPNLHEHTAKELAEIHEINSRADATYLEWGALDANRLAVHRFGGEQYNPAPPTLPEQDVEFMNKTAENKKQTPPGSGEEGA
jgi:phage-related protein (TIGR01555 family)